MPPNDNISNEPSIERDFSVSSYSSRISEGLVIKSKNNKKKAGKSAIVRKSRNLEEIAY